MGFIVKTLDFGASIIFNFRAFPWSIARKLPIKIAYNTK